MKWSGDFAEESDLLLHAVFRNFEFFLAQVGDIRQVGLMAGVELVKDWRTRQSFDLRERAGMRVCEGMARRGVLTRPIGNVVVLMPPLTGERRIISPIFPGCFPSGIHIARITAVVGASDR